MTADLTVVCGSERHEFTLGQPPWSPGRSGPDVWCSLAQVGEMILAEVEVSNASITIGQKARPTIEAEVSVAIAPGNVLVQDVRRPWPHTWFPMRAACRRYAIYPKDRPDLAQAAADLASMKVPPQFGPNGAGPCEMAMPQLTAAQAQFASGQAINNVGKLAAALVGNYPCAVEDSEDGPLIISPGGWRPHGPIDRGAPGGSGVWFDSGWQQHSAFAQLAWLQACCAYERAWHAFDRATGRPITADDYPDGALKYAAGTGDPNNGWLPEFVGIAPWPDPLPLCYDSAHSIRGMRHAIYLSDITSSPMVKRMIASEAAQMRLQFGERGAGPAYGYTPANLKNFIAAAQASPHTGGGISAGRIMGWPAYICAQDVKVNGLTGSEKFCDAMLEWAALCAPPHGVCQRVTHNPPAPPAQDIWYDPTWDLAHSFEVPIFWFGVQSCAKQRGHGMLRGMLHAAISLFESVRKGTSYGGDVGPMDYLYVAHRGGEPVYPLVDGKPGSDVVIGDPTHQEAFAALTNLTVDGLSVGHVCASIPEKRAFLQSLTNLYGKAFLLAAYQDEEP